MKKSQKLKVEIAGMVFETTYAKIPEKIRVLADYLESDYNESGVYLGPVGGMVVDGSDELYVKVGFLLAAGERLPRPKVKEKIFGYDADEFMARQYK